MENESFCRWIIGGEAVAIVTLWLYIVKQWREQRAEDRKELASMRKLLNEDKEG